MNHRWPTRVWRRSSHRSGRQQKSSSRLNLSIILRQGHDCALEDVRNGVLFFVLFRRFESVRNFFSGKLGFFCVRIQSPKGKKHGQQLQFHITALMRVRILQSSNDDLVQWLEQRKNNQPCFVYGLAVQWSNSRIVAPEVAGSNPVQVAKCVLHLKGKNPVCRTGKCEPETLRALHDASVT